MTPDRNLAEGRPVFRDPAVAANWVLARDRGELTTHELRFVDDLARSLRHWPARPKQRRWLRALVDRLGGRLNALAHSQARQDRALGKRRQI